MVSGYNHNIKYQGQIFHVQTEDSGLQSPHVISHVFIGGTIVATSRVSYADALGQSALKEFVLGLMQKQHKQVLKSLIHGDYDAAIVQMQGYAAKLTGPTPLNVTAGQQCSSFGRQAQQPAPVPQPVAVAADAARPAFSAPPPTPHYMAPPPHVKAGEAALPLRPIPPGEEGYAEAQLIEADEQSVDSLFSNLITAKPLDEVILSFLGHDKAKQ